MSDLVIGAKKSDTLAYGKAMWKGVLRDGGRVVFECGHNHRGRLTAVGLDDSGAVECVRERVKEARDESLRTSRRENRRGRTLRSLSIREDMREVAAKEAVERYDILMAGLKELVSGRRVVGSGRMVFVADFTEENS